jgi:GNAT superfamily N-acetyltransferase
MTMTTSTANDLDRYRASYGRCTEFWTGDVPLVIEDGRWLAFSDTRAVAVNIALCYGAAGGNLLAATMGEIKDRGIPSALFVAGEALGSVQKLVREGWVCIGARPLMIRSLADLPDAGSGSGTSTRKLGPADMPVARRMIEETFDAPPELSDQLLPDRVLAAENLDAWGLFLDGVMVSCMGTTMCDDLVAIWSMATPAVYRRRGYGRKLLLDVLSEVGRGPSRTCMLSASSLGEPFYHSLGFSVLERWQMWSRPRWVFAVD